VPSSSGSMVILVRQLDAAVEGSGVVAAVRTVQRHFPVDLIISSAAV